MAQYSETACKQPLPTASSNAGDFSSFGQLAKTNAAQTKLAHEPMAAATAPATINQARGKFRLTNGFIIL